MSDPKTIAAIYGYTEGQARQARLDSILDELTWHLRTRPLDRANLEGHLRRVLASVEGVLAVTALRIVVDRATREATLTVTLRVDTGDVVAIEGDVVAIEVEV